MPSNVRNALCRLFCSFLMNCLQMRIAFITQHAFNCFPYRKKTRVNIACTYLCISLLGILLWFLIFQICRESSYSSWEDLFIYEVTELRIAWKFDKLKTSVLFLLDLVFEMYCKCLGFGFLFACLFWGWFCLVLVTHCDITFGCALPQLEKKDCRAVEGTKQCAIPGEYVLICVCKTSRGENSSYPFLAKTLS